MQRTDNTQMPSANRCRKTGCDSFVETEGRTESLIHFAKGGKGTKGGKGGKGGKMYCS